MHYNAIVSVFISSILLFEGISEIPGGAWGLFLILLGAAFLLSILLKSPPFKALASILQALAVRIGGKAYLEQQRYELDQKRRKIAIELQGENFREVIDQIKDRLGSNETQKRLPQGTITLFFSDIEGWTPIAEQGDERAHQLLQDHHQIFRRAINLHEGWEVKSYGDGFMLAFPSAKKAILCALEIQKAFAEFNQTQDRPLRVRIGINSGEPIQQGDDYIGRAVNLASRIQNEANGGQTLISEVVKNLAGPIQGIQYIDRGFFKLQGIEEKQHLFEVLAVQSLAPGPQGALNSGDVERPISSLKDK